MSKIFLTREMCIIKVHRVIVTCPQVEDEIYVVMNGQVGLVRDVSASRIYEQGFNFQFGFKHNDHVNLEIWKYEPQEMLLKCQLSRSHVQNDGLGLVFHDELWQIFLECQQILDPSAGLATVRSSRKCTPKPSEPHKSQKTLKRSLQKRISLLTGDKKSKKQNKTQKHNYFAVSQFPLKHNDTTRIGSVSYSSYVNSQVSFQYGFQESMAKNHRNFIVSNN